MNTSRGTVVGEAAGPDDALQKLATWLQTVGSPKSRIERATIQPVSKDLADFPDDFAVRK